MTTSQEQQPPTTSKGFWLRAVILFLLSMLIGPGALFLAAGTLKWGMAWAFTGLYVLAVFGSRVLVWRKDPGLLTERARSLKAEDAKPWDRRLAAIVGLYGPLAGWITMGLDKRFNWSPDIPLGVALAALALTAAGMAFSTWAMIANRYFSAVVRIQTDREHQVITTGPYAVMRHPGYAGAVLTNLVTPIALGSLWAYIPAGLTVIVTVIRTALEDRTLIDELDGYKDYAQRTRYRLVPGVW